MKHQKRRMIFVLSSETENMLREMAERKNLAMSDIIRRAIEVFYNLNK